MKLSDAEKARSLSPFIHCLSELGTGSREAGDFLAH
jgi:hypothetical protein